MGNLWMWIGVETNYELEYEQYVRVNGVLKSSDHLIYKM